jgi:hypothetical protein
MSNQDETIDALILSAASGKWQKVAIVISKVFDDPAFDGAGMSAQNVAEQLYILVDNGQLAVQGNMRRWRDGQVRLVEKG